jgi:hypothetical protein
MRRGWRLITSGSVDGFKVPCHASTVNTGSAAAEGGEASDEFRICLCIASSTAKAYGTDIAEQVPQNSFLNAIEQAILKAIA